MNSLLFLWHSLPLLQAGNTIAQATQQMSSRGIGSLGDLCVIALAGSFGGLVYSIQNNLMTFPFRDGDHRVNLGFFANLLFGIAGAIVIFLIVPGDFTFDYRYSTSSDFIKSIATAILGGYGGLALVNTVFNKSLSGEIRAEIKQGMEAQKTIDEEILTATDNLLSVGNMPDLTEREFSEKLKEASPTARMVVMNMAKQVRTENWRDNKAQMERSIPVLHALTEANDGNNAHRALGQLAFALKDRSIPDYKGALEKLNEAIAARNKENSTGFPLYEFNRAICLINLDSNFKNKQASDNNTQNNIIADLQVAFADAQLNDRLQKSVKERGDRDVTTIRDWLRFNRISAQSVSPTLAWIDTI